MPATILVILVAIQSLVFTEDALDDTADDKDTDDTDGVSLYGIKRRLTHKGWSKNCWKQYRGSTPCTDRRGR